MMAPMDAETFRATSRERWESAAEGWARHREAMQRDAMPVSQWLLDAIDPQPGQTILELAAGPGDTGLLAAQRVAPDGRAIITDGADAMVEVARARAQELGVENVELRAMEAEWIDLPAASVDGVVCRWAYMLLADPEAALRETRRVLRPGGRVALVSPFDMLSIPSTPPIQRMAAIDMPISAEERAPGAEAEDRARLE